MAGAVTTPGFSDCFIGSRILRCVPAWKKPTAGFMTSILRENVEIPESFAKFSRLLPARIWNEKNPHDLSKAIFTQIWVDLKERRFLNSMNGVSHKSEPGSSNHALHQKHSFLSFLGW